jgi:hypothetical protein
MKLDAASADGISSVDGLPETAHEPTSEVIRNIDLIMD